MASKLNPEVEKFFAEIQRRAIVELAKIYPESVLAGVYHVDDVAIVVTFDPHHVITLSPSE